MKTAIATCVLFVLLPVWAFADAGYQSDMKIVMDFGDFFTQLGSMVPQDEGNTAPAVQPEVPSKMELTGKMYWTDTMMRLDLDPVEGMHESTIVDTMTQVSYRLDHVNKTATKLDMSGLAEELQSSYSMPDPEMMASDWEGYLEAMRAMDGTTINELAPKAVNGYDCRGVSFSIDPSVVFAQPEAESTSDDETDTGTDDDMAGVLGALAASMGQYSGEVWVADGIRMPVNMSMSMMMMNYTWDLTNISSETLDPDLFQVPEDYEVVEMQLPDMSEIPDFSEAAEPEPAPAGD